MEKPRTRAGASCEESRLSRGAAFSSASPSQARCQCLCPVSSHSHNTHMADSRSRNRSRADIHNRGHSRNSHGDSIVGNKPFRRAYSFSFELAEFRRLELIAASAFDPIALIAISIVAATILGSRKRIVPPGFESFLTQPRDGGGRSQIHLTLKLGIGIKLAE